MNIALEPTMFAGAVSVEEGAGWLRPCRLPCDRLDLFPSPDDSLVEKAWWSSGVRLRLETNTTTLRISFRPIAPEVNEHLDLTVVGKLVDSQSIASGGSEVMFRGLSTETKTVEVWLPAGCSIALSALEVDENAVCRPAADTRRRWVTYGSSLTHCVAAHSPARTWPAIVARRANVHLTALGFGGNCCLEPMVGMVIRELPADIITMKLGINCIGGALSPRTFAAAVTGLVQIIREKKPETPMALISPIGYPPNETEPNVVGGTITQMRDDIRKVHSRLVARGDQNLYHFDGLDVFNLDEIARYAEDQCHPNGDGIEVMAENFHRNVWSKLPVPLPIGRTS